MTELLTTPDIASSIIFWAFSLAIAVHDLKSMKIPDLLVYSGTAVLFIYKAAFSRSGLTLCIISSLLSVALFAAVRSVSRGGLGWGDVKYSALCGLYAGLIGVFVGYIVSALFCALYFLILKALKKYDKEKAVPFAPFMAAGTIAVTLAPIVKTIGS
ncbi:MAG TPA: hypothetical protein DEO40_00085 [Treponema sp.]|jgi:prepilin signal peptidase PulO-like enzyme (type II secretory pathway)|nr:hypothetical protein [Treponema sp.]HBB42872.1 hypothetical protein [Treponema sp.]HCA19059.1 hypothetical protein [Treponema sp.]